MIGAKLAVIGFHKLWKLKTLQCHCSIIGRPIGKTILFTALSKHFPLIYYSVWFLEMFFPRSTLTLASCSANLGSHVPQGYYTDDKYWTWSIKSFGVLLIFTFVVSFYSLSRPFGYLATRKVFRKLGHWVKAFRGKGKYESFKDYVLCKLNTKHITW